MNNILNWIIYGIFSACWGILVGYIGSSLELSLPLVILICTIAHLPAWTYFIYRRKRNDQRD